MDDDEDRAAILGRRARLIALALTSLTGGAACEEPAVVTSGGDQAVEVAPVTPAVVAPMQPDTPGVPTLAPIPPAEPVVDDPDPQEIRHAEGVKRRLRSPLHQVSPCLSPMVCLSIAPQVCLFFKVDDRFEIEDARERDPDDEPV